MTTTLVAFFCKISDPRFGGTYMTLMNTVQNLSNKWSSYVVLETIDFLTVKKCSIDTNNHCSTLDLKKVSNYLYSYSQFFHNFSYKKFKIT